MDENSLWRYESTKLPFLSTKMDEHAFGVPEAAFLLFFTMKNNIMNKK
jgi:hypothetical protein